MPFYEMSIDVSPEAISEIAEEYCQYQRDEYGSVFYKSDVEDMVTSLLADAYEEIVRELPRLLTNPNNKAIDFKLLIRQRTSNLVEVDSDRLYQVEPIAA